MADIPAHHHPLLHPGQGVALFVGALLVAVIAMLGWGFMHRGAASAIVLVSVDDCRRAFDDADCRVIVERAQAVQAASAPAFAQRETCEMVYGEGRCAELKDTVIALGHYAPAIAAIALTSDRAAVLPLYYGKADDAASDPARIGRLVYFRGRAVGRLMRPKLGVADAPYIADEKGAPLSADAIRALARR
ncbi:MAG TPA: DUF1190 domain-containing protein [Stellaceae bacterium]|nr:DUF1190 domain-containing protein [Stellaceae bacterium]